MIKCMFLLRRAPHLSFDEFSAYWSERHSRLAIDNAPLMGMKRYVQNHRAEHEVVELFRAPRGVALGDFDGIAEGWWDSFEDMAEAAGRTPEDVAAAILADERRFIDMERSIIWFCEEKPFWPVA